MMGQTTPAPNQRLIEYAVDRVLDETNTDTKILVLARQDGQADGVAGRGTASGQGHPSLDKLRQFLDVVRIQFGLDRVFLPVDLDVDDLGLAHIRPSSRQAARLSGISQI